LTTENDYIVACDNLVKIYKIADLEVVALQGLDLVVDYGELMAIVGASGSGKSTLLNILGGLDHPSAGKVYVDGQDLLKVTGKAMDTYRREKVGFVWQQTSRNLVPYLTAQENVELPMIVAGRPRKERTRWATELLESVELADRRDHKLSQLSGGQQQRVAIAVALANRPILLLADEPTGEVDSNTADTIFRIFRKLNENFNLTTIIVTHDPRIATAVDRVVAIRDGKTSTETVRHVQQVERAMMGEETGDGNGETQEHVSYREYVVLDSAGRLQIPQDYREMLDIGDRVEVDMLDEGILIKPVEGRGIVSDEEDLARDRSALYKTAEQEPEPKKGFLARVKKALGRS
jgi:ABC-type lipoprotein export system ATPase subunit/bifunctional DNA-binding transcriptional regulator/antitoxin component of YhaV-PrlF toxin-antitoxin module